MNGYFEAIVVPSEQAIAGEILSLIMMGKIDPVIRVIVDNGCYTYEFKPEDVSLVTLQQVEANTK